MSAVIHIGGAKYRSRTGGELLIHYPRDHPDYGRSHIEWRLPTHGAIPIESEDAERAIADGTVTLHSTRRTGAIVFVFATAAPKAAKPKFRQLDLDEPG